MHTQGLLENQAHLGHKAYRKKPSAGLSYASETYCTVPGTQVQFLERKPCTVPGKQVQFLERKPCTVPGTQVCNAVLMGRIAPYLAKLAVAANFNVVLWKLRVIACWRSFDEEGDSGDGFRILFCGYDWAISSHHTLGLNGCKSLIFLLPQRNCTIYAELSFLLFIIYIYIYYIS